MHDLLTVHNDLIDLPLKKFNASEIDILHAICYEVREKGVSEVNIKLSKIRELAHYKNKNNEAFIESVKETNRKLLALNFELTSEDKTKTVQFALFPTFETDTVEDNLKVKVNEPFAYILNNLSGNYTALQLKESAGLKSAYAKHVYKKLQEFKGTGKWIVTLEGFKEYLDIPRSYTPHNIDQRVIEPAMLELKPIVEGLKVEKTYQKAGRGRPRLSGYIWTFKVADPVEDPALTQEDIASVTGWEETPRYCPECKRPIYRKMLENGNGTYYLYGHTDWRTGKCSYTTTDFSRLLQEHELEPVPEPVTEEQKAQVGKIQGFLSKIFGA